jgi:hypothetical protein
MFAALAGCGGGSGPTGTGLVMLGGANPDGTGFVELSGDVQLIPGSQGGFHVWLKFRVEGMGPSRVHLRRTARRASDGRLLLTAENDEEIGAPGPQGYWELPNPIPSFMCPSPIGTRVMDEAVNFLVEVTDENGAPLGSASAQATPRCPAGAQADFCARICSG